MTFLEQAQDLGKTKQAWIDLWYLKSKSENSKAGAVKSIRHFETYIKGVFPTRTELEILNELRMVSNDYAKSTQLYLFLNGYVQYLNSLKLTPKTVRLYFVYIKSWFRYNGIKVYSDDIKQFVNFLKPLKERRFPLDIEHIRALYNIANPKYQSIILTAVSSGARISEILQARVNDFDISGYPSRFHIRAETTKYREERDTYISKEASKLITPYLESRRKDEYVYFENYNKNTLPGTVENDFDRIRRKAGLTSKYQNGMFHVNIHSFRSFAYTKMSQKMDPDYAHAILGHHGYMSQYYRLTPEERDQMYMVVEPDLSILTLK